MLSLPLLLHNIVGMITPALPSLREKRKRDLCHCTASIWDAFCLPTGLKPSGTINQGLDLDVQF